jgi:hypothetical protein
LCGEEKNVFFDQKKDTWIYLGCLERPGSDSPEDQAEENSILCGAAVAEVWSYQGHFFHSSSILCYIQSCTYITFKTVPVR